MNRFALVCDNLDIAQESALASFLGEHHYGFWHRLPNCWLMNCPDEVKISELKMQLVHLIGPEPNLMLLAVETWSASIPPEWHDWFAKYWNGTSRASLGKGSEKE